MFEAHMTPEWTIALLLAATATAAISDARMGLIPSWLTLPALTLAVAGHAWTSGPSGLGWAFAAALGCGLVPAQACAQSGASGADCGGLDLSSLERLVIH